MTKEKDGSVETLIITDYSSIKGRSPMGLRHLAPLP